MMFVPESCLACWIATPVTAGDTFALGILHRKLVTRDKEGCGFSWAFGFWLKSTSYYSLNPSNGIRTNTDNHDNFIDLDIVTRK